jgi:hypothetical protein
MFPSIQSSPASKPKKKKRHSPRAHKSRSVPMDLPRQRGKFEQGEAEREEMELPEQEVEAGQYYELYVASLREQHR